MFNSKYVRDSIIGIILVVAIASNAHAVIVFQNLTRDPNTDWVRKQFIENLSIERPFFLALLQELDKNSYLRYQFLIVDPEFVPIFPSQASNEERNYGGFLAPLDSAKEFSLSRLKTEKEKKRYTELYKAVQGKPVLFALVRLYQDKNGKNMYENPKATLVHEAFHAVQFEFRHQDNNEEQYYLPANLPVLEVEANVFNCVAEEMDESFEASRCEVENMDKLVEYFFKTRNGYVATQAELVMFNAVLEKVWKRISKNGTDSKYPNEGMEGIIPTLYDLTTIPKFLRRHNLKHVKK